MSKNQLHQIFAVCKQNVGPGWGAMLLATFLINNKYNLLINNELDNVLRRLITYFVDSLQITKVTVFFEILNIYFWAKIHTCTNFLLTHSWPKTVGPKVSICLFCPANVHHVHHISLQYILTKIPLPVSQQGSPLFSFYYKILVPATCFKALSIF